jgi:diacylglycerol O-acyltransferase / wax synthase
LSSRIDGGRPSRGSSTSPSSRRTANLPRHLLTVAGSTRRSAATRAVAAPPPGPFPAAVADVVPHGAAGGPGRHHATVNDVLLAVTASGLRGLLRSRGEPVEDLVVPIYVPITLRPAQHRDQARGNLTALMTVPLPVGVPDPGRRLQQIAAETARRKAESCPSVGTVFHGPMPRRAFLAVMSHQHVNLVSADVPGPAQPLYLAGPRLLEVFPVLPLLGKTTLGVGALSYAGQFNIMAVADQDTCPDLEAFAAAARDELAALAATTRATPDRHEQR